MDEVKSYLPPIVVGEAMRGTTIGKVVESKNPEFGQGDLVMGLNGWEDYSISTGYVGPNKMGVIEDTYGLPWEYFLSVLGPTGLTAYFGLLDVAKPKAGETILVSAAAGAVGSIVGQIGKLKGCHVVGIAGSAEKCDWLKQTLGFDAAINYKNTTDLANAIHQACPKGVDIYFENVGGEFLDAALVNMNNFGRIAMCGLIANYNSTDPVPGPYNLWQIIVKSLTVKGFLIRDFVDKFPPAFGDISVWVNDGFIQHRDHVVDGLENAYDAFLMLFDGSNQGKLTVKISDQD